MNMEKIHALIEKYFDGATTAEEEKWLRRTLPALIGSDPEVDGALAVMGYAVLPGPAREKRKHRFISPGAAAAAIAIFVAGAGIYAAFSLSGAKSDLVAYSGGVEVDRQEALRMISSQMAEMGEASREVSSDVLAELDDFRVILN